MKYFVRNLQLPLAVYREAAAHLLQVEGVAIELMPQTSSQFEYTKSQIERLEISLSDAATEEAQTEAQARVEQILAYYGDRYGAWERDTLSAV